MTDNTVGGVQVERLLETLLLTSTDGVLFITIDGAIAMVNPVIEDLFGYSRDQLLNKSIWQLPHQKKEQQLLERHFKQLINELPTPTSIFGTLTDKYDNPVPLRIRWNYIHSDDGKAQGILCIIHDISDEIESRTDTGPTILEQVQYSRLASVEEVVARISHELNQPLSAIINFSGGTLKRLEQDYPNSDIMQSMKMILRQAKRAGDVIDRVKNFLRKGELRKEPLNINQVVEDVIACMHPEISAANVKVQLELERLIPAVIVDKVQIEQVLLNLIQNALESMRTIDIEKRMITIQTYIEDIESVGINVIDKGHGIEAGDAEKIFEAFFTTKSTGMGIGLAISQSIMRAHGGDIQVESTPNVGSKFKLSLKTGVK